MDSHMTAEARGSPPLLPCVCQPLSGRIPGAATRLLGNYFLLAANLWIINFDILLKGGGIISYLGLDTIFLSDLNLEMWSDRLGTRGGRRRRAELGGDTGHLVGRLTKLGGYGSSRKEDKLEGSLWGVPRKVVLG